MANTDNVRKYTGKDVDMLTTCATIALNALSEEAYLVSKRPAWAAPYFENLRLRIKSAFSTHLGVDNAKDLRESTQILLAQQAIALPKLSDFKVQINSDFTNPRRTEILTQLGFTAHLKAVQKKDQEALIELLHKFTLNMTPILKAEIIGAGTSQQLIDDIILIGETLADKNITQETFKSNRPVTSAIAVREFNEIYAATIAIAKISRNFFRTQPEKADKFNYSKIKKALNFIGPNPNPPINP